MVGCARVRVQDLIVPSWGTMKGERVWPLLTWKPVTLPIAWQGRAGQDGSGTVEVWPRTTVVLGTLAALAPTARALKVAREPTANTRISQRPRPGASAAITPFKDLDIHMLLS